ncbi:hypothetical protein JCM10207_006042 [Rhodosporidiobolus poonsookiae]
MLTPPPDSATAVDKLPPKPPPSSSLFSLSSLVKILVGLVLIQYLHWPAWSSLPRIQPVRYPARPGQDIVYGFRIASSPEKSGQWVVELGKISDDALKGQLAGSFAGLTDNWLYLRVSNGEETHLVLASLFLANLITRQEAEAVLTKGPAQNVSIEAVIHRVPSFATLGAAYYAGSTYGTRRLLGPRASEGTVTPAAVGGASAAGVALFSSKSALFSGPPVGERKAIENVPHADRIGALSTSKQLPPLAVLLQLSQHEVECDLKAVEVLNSRACQDVPAYGAVVPVHSGFSTASTAPSCAERLDSAAERLRAAVSEGEL